MAIFKSPLVTELAIQQPPGKRFSQLDNIINGYLVTRFSEPTDVLSIEYGFKGTVFTNYNRVYYDYNYALNQPQLRRITLTDEYPLCDRSYTLGDFVRVGRSYHFCKGDEIKYPINITIPNDVYLPSSTDCFGSNADHEGRIRVTYEIYVKVTRKSTLFDHEKTQYWYNPIVYQANSGTVLDDSEQETIICTVHDIFKDKLKKFYYDEKLAALIPNDIERSHSHSRAIIQLWNSSYRKENYKKLTKNVDITMSLALGKYLYINLPLLSRLSIHLSSGLYADDPNGNNSKEFQFNGQSTKLGYFKLKKISILLNTVSTLRVHGFGCKMSMSRKLVELDMKNLSFDIKDFRYDKDCMMFAKDILGEELSSVSKESLMSLINEKDTLMLTCQLGDYFTNKSALEFQIVVGDDTENKNLTYKFNTEVSPEFLASSSYENFNTNSQMNEKDELNKINETPPAYSEFIKVMEKS